MKVIALTSFVHGAQHLRAGDEAEFSDNTAAELAGRGLVRSAAEANASAAVQAPPVTRAARTPLNKKAAEPVNKAIAGGTDESPAQDARAESVAGLNASVDGAVPDAIDSGAMQAAAK